MTKSPFDPLHQISSTTSKIVVGLERVSEAFKALLWERAKVVGLSPIQIQLLIFVTYHEPILCQVSHLAREFNVTKPTISDAVRVLDKKGLITKSHSATDNRSYSIRLTDTGRQVVSDVEQFAQPIRAILDQLGDKVTDDLYSALTKLITELNQKGILTVQRTCKTCVYYRMDGQTHYCSLLDRALADSDIRLDCPEHSATAKG